MTYSLLAVQTALFAALDGLSPAVADGGIHNDPPLPDETVFPYVLFHMSQELQDDVAAASGSDNGASAFFDLHVYNRGATSGGTASGARGDKPILEAFARVRSLLHDQSLSVSGRASAHAWVRQSRLFTENDGLTRHGVLTVEVTHRD